SKLILPAHLAHSTIRPVDEDEIFAPLRDTAIRHWPGKLIERAQRRTRHGLQWTVERVYSPLLARALRARGLTVAIFTGLLIVTAGLFAGGQMRFVLFPDVPGEISQMTLTMQNGTPTAVRNAVLLDIERALYRVRDRYLEQNPAVADPLSVVATFTNPDGGQMIVEMPPVQAQTISMGELTRRWREEVGEVPGVRTLTFASATNIGGGAPLSFALSGSNVEALEQAAGELAAKLATYAGVFDVRNSASPGGDEIRLGIKPNAQALGITLTSLGTQVRQAFYGEEIQRIQRGTEELKVMVRYPEDQRRSVANLESMLITTPDGDQVPFAEVAQVHYDDAYSVISRLNASRTVTVSADLDSNVVEPGTVIEDIQGSYLPELLSRYSGVEFNLSGASLEEQEFVHNLTVASIAALFLIYALIAIPLKSYTQPLIIMSVIPFGFVGAVVGHLLLGQAISMFSLFGLIALAGVVVNDSLIMMDFVNRARARGVPAEQAVIESGRARFRAIVLTSLTTAIGLMPIMLEQSTQAQFVIPMAISLSFGILFATVLTLILVPVLYLMQGDVARWASGTWLWLAGRQAGGT
ncbi:MAG: efflux RND transporter permease subunit, partial [Chromatocurvus sp.]